MEVLGNTVVRNDELSSRRHTHDSSGFREDLEELVEVGSGQLGNLASFGRIPGSVAQFLPELVLVELDPLAVSHASAYPVSHSHSPCVLVRG